MDSTPSSRFARCAALAAALAACALAGAPAPGRADPDHVELRDRVAFRKGSGATEAVRRECGLQELLPRAIADASHQVELVATYPKHGRVLRLLITDVHAPGGGPFSGPKWMEVSAWLIDDGHAVATTRAKRVAGGPFAGTCGQLQRIARAIGGDLADWVHDPRRNLLGDAR